VDCTWDPIAFSAQAHEFQNIAYYITVSGSVVYNETVGTMDDWFFIQNWCRNPGRICQIVQTVRKTDPLKTLAALKALFRDKTWFRGAAQVES
jgi:hypothetical protein